MKQEIIDIASGKDYSDYLPEVGDAAGVEQCYHDMVVSEVFLPVDNADGFEVPATNMHIIGVQSQGSFIKGEYHSGNGRWESVKGLGNEAAFGIGAAGDNAVGWRWLAEDVIAPMSNIVIHFSPEKLAQVAMETFDKDASLIEVQHQMGKHDALIYQLAKAMQYEMNAGDRLCSMYLEQSLHMLCVHVISRYCTFNSGLKVYRGGLSALTLKSVVEYMEEHFNQRVSLEQLALLSNLSCFHFARLFKQSTGFSPRQYVLKIRVRHAKKLLVDTRLSVEQIGVMVGYDSANNFTRMFSRQTGYSPLRFRKLQ